MRRSLWTIVGAAVLIVIVYFVLAWIVDGYFGGEIFPHGVVPSSWSAPNSWATWRDIFIVFMSFFWALAGLLAIVLLVVLIFLALLVRNVVRQNAVPALDSLKDTLDNVRGTTEFAGETVAAPLVRTYSVARGVSRGILTLTHLPGRIGSRRRKRR